MYRIATRFLVRSVRMPSVLEQVIRAYSHPEKLKIRNPARASTLIDSIIEGGLESFQAILDFDYTITKYTLPNGKVGESGFGVMTYSPLMTDAFRARSEELLKHYHPIEIDHKMTTEEKIPLMVEWYEKRRELIIGTGITKTDIDKMVANCNVVLRDGAKTALSNLNDSGVPTLIFSAGNGTILKECLKRDGALFPNQHIVSNFMKYDETGKIIGYENETLIHQFNKNEHAVKDSGYFEDLKHRSNALVIGDSVGDLSMMNGMSNPGSILKIGFLNLNIEQRLESFEENFDVVLIDDQTFEFVNLLLSFILKK